MIGLWLACSAAPDPQLAGVARAVQAFDEGQRLLADGRFAEARARFATASVAAPSPLLSAWEAKAAADDGDLDAALAHLDRALAGDPSFAEARYNRAAYLARLERPDDAAPELARALEDGAALPLSVLEDPDFARYLGHPAFRFLPREALTVAAEPPVGPVFWGAEIALRLQLLGIVRDPIHVVPETFDGPLLLTAVVEDEVSSTQGPSRDLRWSWKVVGPGPIRIGPTRIGAGRYQTQVAAIELQADAPPDVEVPALQALTLPTVHAVIDPIAPRTAAFVVGHGREAPGQWVARLAPGDRAQTEPPLPSPTRFELRRGGEPVEIGLRWPIGAAPSKVVIRDADGTIVFQGP